MRFLIILISAALLSSCVSHKKVTYFNDVADSMQGPLNFPEPPVVLLSPNDVVEIEISSTSSETNQFFQRSGSDVDKQYAGNTYQIANDGSIKLPLIGAVNISGLDTDSATVVIQTALLKYLQKPTVSVRLVSFKFTVLGEVERPGVYNVPAGQVSVLEALGYAGDLTIFGKRENVMLIRNNDDKKEYHRIDLNATDFIQTEYFYLTNNDVLYIEPSKGATSKDDNAYRILPLVISSLTFLIVVVGISL